MDTEIAVYSFLKRGKHIKNIYDSSDIFFKTGNVMLQLIYVY